MVYSETTLPATWTPINLHGILASRSVTFNRIHIVERLSGTCYGIQPISGYQDNL